MELKEFLENFAEQFDDTDPSEITPECIFHELNEWSSLTGMAIIAMSKSRYGKTLTGKELHDCETVEDLFNLLSSK